MTDPVTRMPAPDRTRTAPRAEPEQFGGLTFRAVALGLIVAAVSVLWVIYSEFIVHASRLNLSNQPMASFALFVLVVVVNALVGVRWPAGALRPPELLVIFVAGFVATPLTTSNMQDWLFSALATPHYLATPENRWAELLLPHLKKWAVVTGPASELRWAYVGMPSGEQIPWGIWMLPLFWWTGFLIALFVSSLSISVIMRRQWVDYERLLFPLVQLPIEMLERPGGRFRLPAMLRSRLFWTGAAIPCGIVLWNIIGYFSHGFPRIGLMDPRWMTLVPGFPGLYTKINFYAMGFAFLVDARILFSVWVFWLIGVLQIGISNRLGLTLGSSADLMSSRDAITSWIGFGALIVLVAWGLWMARRHLRDVWVAARTGRATPADEEELLSPRWAMAGLASGMLYMAFWLHHLGMPWKLVALFGFGTLVANLGMARMMAQAGLIYVRAPLTANVFALFTVGPANLSPEALGALAGTYTITAFNKGMFVPYLIHVARLTPSITRVGRSLLKLLVAATAVAMVVGIWYTIEESYRVGSTGFGSWPYPKHGLMIYQPMVDSIVQPKSTDFGRLACLGIGALVMIGLTGAHYRFPWWPLHPLGLPMYTTWSVETTALTIFLVWLAKSTIMRIGGMSLYERVKPLFIGMPVGYALGVTISFAVDMLWFPGAGNAHQLHTW